jgi:regulator of cell morphogenesis and NO signaling
MIEVDEKIKVADIVVQNPETRPILERMGIDYCCGGKLTLREAAENLGMAAEDVIRDLSKAIENSTDRQQYRNWSSESVTELANYIEKTHHSFMKEQFPRLERLLEKTLSAHKEKHSQMLTELKETCAALKSEIELHLAKEEQILFPFIRQIDSFQQNQTDRPELHCGSIENPIGQMEYEHKNAGTALDKMRRITSDYKLPDDACNTFRSLYDGLKALEADLHEHIHLENNILFPRAIELEKSI